MDQQVVVQHVQVEHIVQQEHHHVQIVQVDKQVIQEHHHVIHQHHHVMNLKAVGVVEDIMPIMVGA